ncbi:P-loop containing nucleoside triphosphate hydrolase protein [Gyrodon lividus]|nr:P-loop containing nucleoside triphosphate hydrolase protein [Gyrodon lividus]
MLRSRLLQGTACWKAVIVNEYRGATISHRRVLNFGHHRQRPYSSSSTSDVVVHISNSNIYRFGDSTIAAPVFRDVNWTVKNGENWAVIGSGSNQKTALLQTLHGHLKIVPPPPPPDGLFPFLSGLPRDPHAAITLVSFAHRPNSAGGAFYDYTARYGAVREEDRITLRESMFGEHDFLNLRPKGQATIKTPEELAAEKVKKYIFEDLTARLGLSPLLDLPLIALSNGQTRRARIVKAILSQPELLLLDEPLTGLDANKRPTLLSVLRSLHEARSPRIIMGLRSQDPVPDWITHLALVHDGKVLTGTKEEIFTEQAIREANDSRARSSILGVLAKKIEDDGKPVVVLKNVKVAYGPREVVKSINWTIREGQRWHLQGANGSGKTTLLSVVTGDHPQSYTQRGESYLELFSRPRQRISTPHLRSLIGVVSPELANAYPRRAGTTVWEVIGTGFDGGFVPGGKSGVGVGLEGGLTDNVRQWRVSRVREVLCGLGPSSWAANPSDARPSGGHPELAEADERFSKHDFVNLSPGEQSIVLLMRALVSRPQLVLLDEVWAGMDDGMVRAARRYLREGGVGTDQAIVVISHWEEEVPWTTEDGLRKFMLEDGMGSEV